MANTLIERRQDEGDVEFLERAADVAAACNGSLDVGNGPICPRCAPFGDSGQAAEILKYRACYNCDYETRD